MGKMIDQFLGVLDSCYCISYLSWCRFWAWKLLMNPTALIPINRSNIFKKGGGRVAYDSLFAKLFGGLLLLIQLKD